MDGDYDKVPMLGMRPPPVNLEAEKAVLGAIMANNRCLDALNGNLKPEHFADEVHGRIFESICSIVEQPGGGIADPVTLKNLFEQDGTLQAVGGTRYLAELAASMVSIINVVDYGKLIYELHLKRRLLALGERVVYNAHEPELDVGAQIAEIETAVSIIQERHTLGIPQDPASQIQRTLHGLEKAARGEKLGRSTGLTALDKIIGGLMPETLYVLAARPSMGKSALGQKLAEPDVRIIDDQLVSAPSDTWEYSGEMPAEQLHRRRIAQLTRIAVSDMRNEIDADTFDRIYLASQQLDRSFWIDDTPRLTFDAIRRRAMRHAERHPLGLIVVDHLGKVAFRDPDAKNDVRQIGEITGGLKDLSKELKVPVVLLVQLNRGVEGREDKRPTLQDLRGSGNIEEDADVVGFLYRESYYLERMPPAQREKESALDFSQRTAAHYARLDKIKNLAEVIFAKNRDGPTETARIYWNGPLMMFGNLKKDDPTGFNEQDMGNLV